MIIGIEAERANIENPTGVEHYARQMILHLAEVDHENNYILYLRRPPQQWILELPANFKCKVIPFPIFWTQLRISWEMLVNKPDALFIMASALPIIHPDNSVVTIHDLAWIYYPETFGLAMRYYLKFSTWFACRYARKIIAVSGQTRRDLMQKYSLPESKITVVYHGFSHEEPVQSSPEELKKIEDLPAKFVLYLGTLQPRKNPQGLIDAFIELKKERGLEHSLVLVGGKGWLYSEIMDKISRHPEVIYLGYIKDRFAVLRKADLLVQPAFYEGFGLQILDAFSVEVPVAASNVSSLPEIAGDAAAYFDPKNKNDIKQAIYNVLTDKGLRERLVQNGNYRLKEFSWRKCAEQTLSVIKN